MGNNLHILIVGNILTNVHCGPLDVVAVPPDATLIFMDDWLQMCAEAGGEPALIALLGVEDHRADQI